MEPERNRKIIQFNNVQYCSCSGTVTGYYYTNYEEDGLKRDIDEAIKDIQPAVRPGDFTVTFVPVYSNAGTQPIRKAAVFLIFSFSDLSRNF